ncbi:MAG: alpha/beta hydrolase [Actinomycetota bacterium]|nr:alpha/beta hydrolase [Actinomycetota bacterium]
MPTVELRDDRIASYEVVGSGDPMVMFPGGPGFAAAYIRPAAELLAERFQCYLIDPHRIECPVLVVAGEEDLICGPAQAKLIAEGVHTAELVVIPDCGHDPELEAPEEFCRSILEWRAAIGVL